MLFLVCQLVLARFWLFLRNCSLGDDFKICDAFFIFLNVWSKINMPHRFYKDTQFTLLILAGHINSMVLKLRAI
jgi:hypothetical protein